jgi:hypothetical protein
MKLTPEQEARLLEFVTKWAAIGRSTQRADRDRAERAISGLYKLAGLPEPLVIWLPCPLSGALSALVYATLVAKKTLPTTTAQVLRKLALDSTVTSAIDSTVDSAVGAAIYSSVDSAVRAARYSNALDSAVGAAIGATVESAFTSAVDSVCLAVGTEVRSVVESAFMSTVYTNAVGFRHHSMFDLVVRPDAYSNGVDSAVRSAVESVFNWAARSAVYSDVIEHAVRSTVGSLYGGSRWLGCSAWADYFSEVFSIPVERNYLELVQSCGCIWTLDGICFASERPSRLNLDDRRRLHSEVGQSIVYSSGWGLWHWHGVSVSKFVIEQPEMITLGCIQVEANVEARRVMIERYGQARYLVDSGAKLIHKDEMGELYSTNVPGDEPLVMVKVMNSTPEPDDSRKPYFLRVHPECRPLLANGELGAPQPMTARSAVASTFGMTADEYAKHLIAQT